jgi:hypothetical protein
MSYADDTTTTCTDMLGTLERLLDKAEAGGMDDAVLDAKLAEDMYPLETQFRVAINQVWLALGRVGPEELPLDEEAYTSLADVRDRLRAVREGLAAVPPATWADPEAEIDMTLPNGMRFVMTTREYIRDWMLPNFYFHTTMAYALLRHNGLDLGKGDFVGHMARYARAPEG